MRIRDIINLINSCLTGLLPKDDVGQIGIGEDQSEIDEATTQPASYAPGEHRPAKDRYQSPQPKRTQYQSGNDDAYQTSSKNTA